MGFICASVGSERLDSFDFNPLDATKDWFEDVFPYEHVGTMTLDRNPDNIFAETESVGFNPGYLSWDASF